ncbi:ComF family protein [Candidatus Saccharibacteria bacterium]|nr:ComF family protein [Candidatus Saccharibacteria bacterium]
MDFLNYCPSCGKANINGKCENCGLPLLGVFVGGWRGELLGRMAAEYKYHSVRAMGREIGEVMSRMIPDFVTGATIVPLPTISKHIRERGVDHTKVIAKWFARYKGWEMEPVLVRKGKSVQVGADAKTREKQAKKAYEINPKFEIDKNKIYVLFDDVWTTGSSMKAAAEVLRKNGAEKIVAVVVVANKRLEGEGGEDEVDDGVGEEADY